MTLLLSKPARIPEIRRPRRMDRLATLPLFFPLEGRRVVVVGGTEAVAWKAELLSAAGANVEVWTPNPCTEIEQLAADPPAGSVAIVRRTWTATSVLRAALVVAATEGEAEAAHIFSAAQEAGVPVNVIDRPEFCTFQFGSIVNRSPLVVGVSTAGAAPVFSQAIRSRIEAVLPAGFARWAEAAHRWRGELRKLGLSAQLRHRFWELFTDLALRVPGQPPSHRDRDALVQKTLGNGAPHSPVGHVTLVGAGPGDPELLTLRALRALRSADVILFDDLVAPEILDFARREAKRMLVGKTGYRPSCTQDSINSLMVALARSGKRVVRLKAGDPLIFGRAGEEIAALEQAGIPVQIVPGISAAQGASASLKRSFTQRGGADRVQFIAGHSCNGGLSKSINMAAITDPKATTAIYMPLGTLQDLVMRLQKAGMSGDRGVVAVFNATRHNEQKVFGTLNTICAEIGTPERSRPCLILIEAEGKTSRSSQNVAPYGGDLSSLAGGVSAQGEASHHGSSHSRLSGA